MPVSLSYPGVYIEEVPSGVRTITGVATSITAFVGRALRGPVNEPTIVNNFGEFERLFGGLAPDHTVAYAVQDFYGNGGAQALIVRLYKPFFPNDLERATALATATGEAQTAADATNEAAQTESTRTTPLPLPDAGSVAAAAANTANAAGAPGSAALLAAKQVAAAAQTESTRPPYTTTTQRMDIAGNPTSGAIKLKFKGEETADIPLGDLIGSGGEDDLEAALEALPSIGGNIASVTRSGSTPNFSFEITFGGTLAAAPQDLIEVSASSVSPGSVKTFLPLPDAASVAAAAANSVNPAVNAAAGTVAPINRARLTFANGLIIEAATPGAWGNSLGIKVDYDTKRNDDGSVDPTLYNLTITDGVSGKSERIRNVTGTPDAIRLVSRVLANESSLVRVVGTPPESRPAEGQIGVDATGKAADSRPLLAPDFNGSPDDKTGLFALDKADLFNLLCIPPDTRDGDTPVTVYQKAMDYCNSRRAMLIVDSPATWSAGSCMGAL